MSRIASILIAFLLTLASIIAMPASPVSANDDVARFQAILVRMSAAPDVYAAAYALSRSDQDLLAKGLRVVRVEETATKAALIPNGSGKHGLAAPMRGFCPDRYFISGFNAFGGEVWRYTLVAVWCWDNTFVNSYSIERYPSDMAVFWNFNGHIGLTQDVQPTYAYTWTQGSFTLCFPWCGVQNSVPVVYSTVYGTGAYSGGQY